MAETSQPAAHAYRHPHPAVAVDLAVFTLREGALHVLLVRRGVEPFVDRWALPGGFVRIAEDLPAAAKRELHEETGITHTYLEQVAAFGHPDRDPRERVISIAFFAITPSEHFDLRAGGDARVAQWHATANLPDLAFDHAQILEQARARLADKVRRSTVGLQFLAAEFTLSELQRVHEAILGERVDKRNFRKWIAGLSHLKPTGKFRKGGQHRPAALYRAKPGAIRASLARGAEAGEGTDGAPAQAALETAYNKGYHDAVRALTDATVTAGKTLLRSRR
jgi:8-oxo-dGTP diphosphatase